MKGSTRRDAITDRLYRIVRAGLAVFIAVHAFSLFASTQARADDFLSAQQKGLAKNPEGMVFTIGFNDNKNQFQQGEIIRVTLSFSSKIQKKYEHASLAFDRGGVRLGMDSYYVDPADGAEDPLKHQYDYSSGIRMGGGRV